MADTWRDRNADSGLRLAHWLSESDERNIRHARWNDPLLGTVWTIELVDDGERVASGRDHHLDEAWVKALESLDARAKCDSAPDAVAETIGTTSQHRRQPDGTRKPWRMQHDT